MVLIISAQRKEAQTVSDIFYYMGIISYAVTPKEALSEISSVYRAAILLEPERLADTTDFITKLRSYDSNLPIFAISDNIQHNITNKFADTFPSSICSSTLIEKIVLYQKQNDLRLTAHYRLAGIDASCDERRVTVFDKPISFTKTEIMILRYLLSTYPIPADSKSILKYAFKPTRKPELTSIRTHISMMNKKFRETRGKNLFLNISEQGYVVSTPEILKELASEHLA